MARIGWAELLAYWRSLHDSAAIPLRGRFDPVVGLPRVVAHLTLFGVEPVGFRVRLVGSELGRWSLQVGRMLDESTLDAPIRDAIQAALQRAVAGAAPVLEHYLAQYDEPVRWTTLYLPLSDAMGCVSAVVTGTFHELGRPSGALRVFHADRDDAACAPAH